ncbi:MAG: hypothetical protein LBS69_12210 [Prevotellaceae bacterium]|jgi:hypothetical protein|nr:hypothetical protein [Prevotellaceae bacterium]
MKAKQNQNAVVSCECVRNLLSSIHGNYEYFRPMRQFHVSCGINCHRWAKLVRGELSITIDELKRLCKVLNVEFTAKTFERQLKLFDYDN